MKIFGFISRILRKIDIYGQRVELNFQKNMEYKTVFGGCFTLMLIILFSIGSWFYGKELMQKKQPTVIAQQISVQQAQRINITSDNLIIMVGVQDGFSKPIVDSTLFTVKAVQEVMVISNNNTSNGIIKKLVQYHRDMVICNDINGVVGIHDLQEYFQKVNLNKYYCLKQNNNNGDANGIGNIHGGVGDMQDDTAYMEGDFDSDRFGQVYIYVEKCKNTTQIQNCQSKEIIDEKLKLTKLSIYMSDKLIDPLDYNNPFKDKGINLYSPTSSAFPKELQLYFTNSIIQSDSGLLFEDNHIIRNFQFVEMKETTFFSDQNVLVRILIRIQKMKENFMERRYLRFADVVAQIGGLLKILTTLGTIVTSPFTGLYLKKAIVDKIFNFDENDGDEDNLSDHFFNDQPLYNFENNNEFINIENSDNISCKNNQIQNKIKNVNININQPKQYPFHKNKQNQINSDNEQSPSNSYHAENQDQQNNFTSAFNNCHHNVVPKIPLQISPRTKQKKIELRDSINTENLINDKNINLIIKQNKNISQSEKLIKFPTDHQLTPKNNNKSPKTTKKQQNQANQKNKLKILNSPNNKSKILDEKKEQEKQQKREKLDIELQNAVLKGSNNNILKRNSLISAAKEVFQVTTQTIKYTFLHFFAHLVCPNSNFIKKKKSLVDQSVSRIIEHLDILYILNKLLEIDKLKSILLNDDQIKLFEYIPKPIISHSLHDSYYDKNVQQQLQNKGKQQNYYKKDEIIDEQIMKNSQNNNNDIMLSSRRNRKAQDSIKQVYRIYHKEKSDAEKALDAYNGLANIFQKEKKSQKDLKLIEFIDNKILYEFEKQKLEVQKNNRNTQDYIPINAIMPVSERFVRRDRFNTQYQKSIYSQTLIIQNNNNGGGPSVGNTAGRFGNAENYGGVGNAGGVGIINGADALRNDKDDNTDLNVKRSISLKQDESQYEQIQNGKSPTHITQNELQLASSIPYFFQDNVSHTHQHYIQNNLKNTNEQSNNNNNNNKKNDNILIASIDNSNSIESIENIPNENNINFVKDQNNQNIQMNNNVNEDRQLFPELSPPSYYINSNRNIISNDITDSNNNIYLEDMQTKYFPSNRQILNHNVQHDDLSDINLNL